MRSLLCLSLLFAGVPAFAELPKDVKDFLGAPPPRFEKAFLRPARDLKAAHKLLVDKKIDAALNKLLPLANGELGEHASFELAFLYRDKKQFSKSNAMAEKVLRNYPGTVYAERLRDLLEENECSEGLQAKGASAVPMLERCLWRQPWKAWGSLEPQANKLYEALKKAKDPMLDPFVAEWIQAMPASSALRQRIAREIPAQKLTALADLARFRSRSGNAPGVKAVFPDAELFDKAMKLALQENWKEANKSFREFLAEFPVSEHADRAQYWVARTEDKLGNSEEAKKIFTQILEDTPFTYYGLQAALYLKYDWSPTLAATSQLPDVKWQGALLSRQALSLWRLRALLENGLLDYAREEARFLTAARGNGAGVGQEDPKGALMMARLFQEAGFSIAAFSHAYAALSLDRSLISEASTRLIFPRFYSEEFSKASEASGVHPLLLASVAKQESAFIPNATSRADALGLLQLLPLTAKEVIPNVEREDLFKPEVNAKAGALYLQKLLVRFQGNIALALAGYNAGPTRAAQWQKDLAETAAFKKGFSADLFIDSIPFSETRKYVGNILRNYAWYKLLNKDGMISSVEELSTQWQKELKKEEINGPPSPTPTPSAPVSSDRTAGL